MTRIAAGRGYDLSQHIAAQVTADDLAWADDVLVMDDENHQQLANNYPNLVRHIRLLDATAIPDPWLVEQDSAYADALDASSRPPAPTWPASRKARNAVDIRPIRMAVAATSKLR
jgi:protein-tyrosine-phosphatase